MTNISTTPTLLSGDQNIFWDSGLKLCCLAHRDLPVTHLIHSADVFSRSSTAGKDDGQFRVEQEYCLPDGQSSHWSATMEMAAFLGRIPLDPNEIAAYVGVPLRKLAPHAGLSLEVLCQRATLSDWWGVLGPSDQLAHNVRVADLETAFKTLRTKVKHDIRRIVANDREAMQRFSRTLDLLRFRHWPLVQAYTTMLAQSTGGCCTISNSVDFFAQAHDPVFGLFIENYGQLSALYNQAIEETGGKVFTVDRERGELPFFALGRREEGWERYSLSRDDRTSDNHRVVVPKAIVLFTSLRTMLPLVLPRSGSGYAATAIRFGKLIQEEVDPTFIQHPLHRISFNALDNLAHADLCFTLPPYLASDFGQETITGQDFARRWRDVVAKNEAKLGVLRALTKIDALAKFLLQNGLIQPQTYEMWQEPKRLLKQGRGQTPDREILTRVIEALEGSFWLEKLDLVVKHLQVVKSLTFWNDRPFLIWVRTLGGGWEEAIIQNAQFYQED